jgi:LssY C-terminus
MHQSATFFSLAERRTSPLRNLWVTMHANAIMCGFGRCLARMSPGNLIG